MALSELDDLLNDLEQTVEDERNAGKVIRYVTLIYMIKYSYFKTEMPIEYFFIMRIYVHLYSAQERAPVTMIWVLVSQTHTLIITHHTCHQKQW
jgi:hypothetical protein